MGHSPNCGKTAADLGVDNKGKNRSGVGSLGQRP
jgi:hypothetical protein